MKNKMCFWCSLEKYVQILLVRSPLPQYWPRITVGLIFIVLLVSLKYAKYSAAGATTLREIVMRAANAGDYETAQRLYESCTAPQCQSVAEELVYPEMKLEKRITELEQKLVEYPSNREVFLMLGDLYDQLGGTRVDTEFDPYKDKAAEYREKARVLDPNEVEF
jgi:cytochrome c-type biogenesis protein CcmH/NrfG